MENISSSVLQVPRLDEGNQNEQETKEENIAEIAEKQTLQLQDPQVDSSTKRPLPETKNSDSNKQISSHDQSEHLSVNQELELNKTKHQNNGLEVALHQVPRLNEGNQNEEETKEEEEKKEKIEENIAEIAEKQTVKQQDQQIDSTKRPSPETKKSDSDRQISSHDESEHLSVNQELELKQIKHQNNGSEVDRLQALEKGNQNEEENKEEKKGKKEENIAEIAEKQRLQQQDPQVDSSIKRPSPETKNSDSSHDQSEHLWGSQELELNQTKLQNNGSEEGNQNVEVTKEDEETKEKIEENITEIGEKQQDRQVDSSIKRPSPETKNSDSNKQISSHDKSEHLSVSQELESNQTKHEVDRLEEGNQNEQETKEEEKKEKIEENIAKIAENQTIQQQDPQVDSSSKRPSPETKNSDSNKQISSHDQSEHFSANQELELNKTKHQNNGSEEGNQNEEETKEKEEKKEKIEENITEIGGGKQQDPQVDSSTKRPSPETKKSDSDRQISSHDQSEHLSVNQELELKQTKHEGNQNEQETKEEEKKEKIDENIAKIAENQKIQQQDPQVDSRTEKPTFNENHHDFKAKNHDTKKANHSPNLAFYLKDNSRFCSWKLWKLEALHGKKGDYFFLESSHSYIQWLIPNHFSSAFNSDSYALTLEDATEFRRNQQIAENLLKSYEIMFDFYGINFSLSGFSRNPNYYERYYDTIAYPTHNHLRMRRILAHLNVVGFRELAIKLVAFFLEEIEKEDSGLGYIKKVVKGTWKKYGEIDEKNEKEVMELLCNCYPQMEFNTQLRTAKGRETLLGYLKERSVIYDQLTDF